MQMNGWDQESILRTDESAPAAPAAPATQEGIEIPEDLPEEIDILQEEAAGGVTVAIGLADDDTPLNLLAQTQNSLATFSAALGRAKDDFRQRLQSQGGSHPLPNGHFLESSGGPEGPMGYAPPQGQYVQPGGAPVGYAPPQSQYLQPGVGQPEMLPPPNAAEPRGFHVHAQYLAGSQHLPAGGGGHDPNLSAAFPHDPPNGLPGPGPAGGPRPLEGPIQPTAEMTPSMRGMPGPQGYPMQNSGPHGNPMPGPGAQGSPILRPPLDPGVFPMHREQGPSPSHPPSHPLRATPFPNGPTQNLSGAPHLQGPLLTPPGTVTDPRQQQQQQGSDRYPQQNGSGVGLPPEGQAGAAAGRYGQNQQPPFASANSFAARAMRSNIFLCRLPEWATDTDILNMTKKYVNVLSVRVMKHDSGASKSIAHLSLPSPREAFQAIRSLNGKVMTLDPSDKRAAGRPPGFFQKISIKADVRKNELADMLRCLSPEEARELLLRKSYISGGNQEAELQEHSVPPTTAQPGTMPTPGPTQPPPTASAAPRGRATTDGQAPEWSAEVSQPVRS
uniref:RRM domain-containing protein n=1 Tax=Chromera velia CCMP2878 TaxID=1169474 RepID=A0A0G4HCL2_9ALVE|eukprot:Cvel_26102.t1-p1 / transcript=Cvel_26102.t1 / gene=Cvel_26102 / organism=Chromera_velia_CCMP2878 / gene_product=IQ motif and SEC7 domain-containing protein 2, putative / transcript_product=IQ motif and SEC7 domain-containing protein 2, putative / location=Cvel_scaffold3051:13026-16838(-) / protein_length=557 / sequence_SO=supercontig / SO=protein_coding / is_pseudo=false